MLRAFQWDLARQTERLDHLLALLPRYAEWGYQELYLHLEDAVDYPSLPGVARADAYSWPQLRQLVATAAAHGIRTVPIVNLLGHTQYLIKHPDYRDLNELRDPDTGAPLPSGQLCPLHPRTLEVAAALLDDVAPLCTAGKIHVGLDESFHLGKHPLSRAEIAGIGLAAHFARYVGNLHGLATARGLSLGIWADMLALLPGAIPHLPRGIAAYDWYYHPFTRHPRMELYSFSEYDLAPALAARDIAYWGCPLNGAFRHESAPVYGDRLANIASWWRRCHATRAAGMLITSWEPHRLALETNTLVDAAAATLWLEPRSGDDPATLLAHGVRRLHGLPPGPARRLARTLLQGDAHAFVGYHRWEINDRWDVLARRESPAPHAAAARYFSRAAATRTSSAALDATFRFQHYLAARDAFVRSASLAVFRLRRIAQRHPDRVADVVAAQIDAATVFAQQLRNGRVAARAMWAASRDAARFSTSPNARVLARDAARLRAWRGWLRAVGRRPAHAVRASPVCGRWQLQFTVHNFAPALQKILVEQQQPDGTWLVLHARFTIEFRAWGARPHTHLRREFSCPVADPARPLRIAVRGLGQVRVSHIELTDGVTSLHYRPLRTHHLLGHAAPSTGLPALDWQLNTGELPLDLR